jgi:diadenylate cyclase
MDDPIRVPRLLLDSAAALAEASRAQAILVAATAMPDITELPPATILIARSDEEEQSIVQRFGDATPFIRVPAVELDRHGQVKLAAIIALSQRMLGLDDTAVFLAGPYGSLIDSLFVLPLGAEYELFDPADQPDLDEHIKRAVFHRVFSLALHLGQHGREGKKVGALIVVGDHKHVLEQSAQMILNPFKGYPERDRNVLSEAMWSTMCEFSTIDGAFIVSGRGIVETAGARLKAGLSEGLPLGLGARHAAAAGITLTTKSVAFTVSESDGTVRVWRAGRMLASLEPTGR